MRSTDKNSNPEQPMALSLIQKGHALTISDKIRERTEEYTVYEDRQIQKTVFGVYGIIIYNGIEYLVVISKVKNAGSIGNTPVFEIEDAMVFAIGNRCCGILLNRLKAFYKLGGLFFSEYDLFRRNSIKGFQNKEPAETPNYEFLFNHLALLSYAKRNGMLGVNCIQGYFSSFNGLCLVSRRSYKNNGLRYFSRGCDAEGNCSNFVETEQFVNGESSYLQLRGSIPLRWSHAMSWKYHPDIVIENDDVSPKTKPCGIFNKAHALLKQKYKEKIKYVNLINDSGYEGKLHNTFRKALGSHDACHFNFHRDSKKKSRPFNFEHSGITAQKEQQKTIIRTNCIDSLDRTNSFQYMVGKAMLEKQLQRGHLTSNSKKVKETYLKAFKRMFYENGNYLSLQYSGTPALLAKNVVGGEVKGLLRDGYYSLKRYFINRLDHGSLQNTYDIICGRRKHGPLEDCARKTTRAVLGFIMCSLISKLMTNDTSAYDLCLIWFSIAVLIIVSLWVLLDLPQE